MRFLIKKGRHYPNITFPVFRFSRVLDGTFYLKGDFSYAVPKQKDTNKLIGLSDGIHHHTNSIRIGFRWDPVKEKTELMSIRYVNGTRYIDPITFIDTNTLYYFRIEIKKSHYLLSINNKTVSLLRESKWFLPRIVLKPYFGGTATAPKDFNFKINLL